MATRDARRLGLIEAALRGRITNEQAAEALGLSPRQFRRLRTRVRLGGAQGLIHRNRGRPSKKRLPLSVRQRVIDLLEHPSGRLNDCHIADLLGEDDQRISPASVRRIRVELRVPAKRRRRPSKHRRRRVREAHRGALVLVDGSPFRWIGDTQPHLTLVGAMDDATGMIVGLQFRPHEDLHGYAEVFRQVFTDHGLPLAIYGDGTNILIRNDTHWTEEEEFAGRQRPTQLGEVLEELGIGYIRAHSPQAKGRIERLWNTLQDRLGAELRLKQIVTDSSAQAYLPAFIKRFNRRFGRQARELGSAWRSTPRDLDRILACRYQRTVARDNTVSVGGRVIQIPPGRGRSSFHSLQVEVRELLDGRLLVLHQGRVIAEQASPPGPFVLGPRDGTRRRKVRPVAARAEPPEPSRQEKKPAPCPDHFPRRYKPAPNHPWRGPALSPVARH